MVFYIQLKQIMEIRTNFEDADFWLVRKGSENMVGKPTKEFSMEHIGPKLNNAGQSIADPQFLYYYFMFLHGQGIWSKLSKGMGRLRHLSVSDVKSFSMPIEDKDD